MRAFALIVLAVVTGCGGGRGGIGDPGTDAGGDVPGRDGAACVAETCNGLDDDCDGAIDEELRDVIVFADADGDGWGDTGSPRIGCGPNPREAAQGGDCNDADIDAHPGAEERCNGADDSCEGMIDEELAVEPCPLQFGVCAGAAARCGGDAGWLSCDAADYGRAGGRFEIVEATCDAVDNDCDGDVDEAVTNACGTCGALPAETCNGEDDDCDGEVDNACPSAPPPTCASPSTRRTFLAPGMCAGVSCEYRVEDVVCPATCADGACVAWAPTAMAGVPAPRYFHTAVWTSPLITSPPAFRA